MTDYLSFKLFENIYLDTFLHILTDIFWVRENIKVILSVKKMVGVKIAPAFGAKKCYFISTQLRPRNSAIGSNMHIKN